MSAKAAKAVSEKLDDVRATVDTIVLELSEVADDLRVWAETKLNEISVNLTELATKLGEAGDEDEDE